MSPVLTVDGPDGREPARQQEDDHGEINLLNIIPVCGIMGRDPVHRNRPVLLVLFQDCFSL
jgi:hypothetical protein